MLMHNDSKQSLYPSFLHRSVFIVGNVHMPYFETELCNT